MSDSKYMQRALALARRGGVSVRPNPLVGALVVRDGKIIAKGWHREFGGPHAEVEALNAAGAHARGATLYVTLEPCNHHGKTPPCTEAIIAAGISRVVIAMKDPNPVARGGSAVLEKSGIRVDCGCLESRALELNASWIHRVRSGKPLRYGLAVFSFNGIAMPNVPLDAEPRLEKFLRLFDSEQMVLVREPHEVRQGIGNGEISRLVVVHAPEFVPASAAAPAAVLLRPLSEMKLLRARRLGRFAVSTYALG